MKIWFIYSLLSALFVGFYSFSSKLSVEKNHNPSLITYYSMIVASLCAIIWLFFSDISFNKIMYLSILFGFFNGAFYVITTITRMESLKYIDTSIYFPIYKAILPISLIIVMVIFFGEKLTINEIIGVIFGITVPILLIGVNKKSKQISKGYYYLLIGIMGALLASISAKLSILNGVNIQVYIFISLVTGTILSYIVFYNNIKKNIINNIIYSRLDIKRTAIITGILQFLGFYFFMKALELGNNISVVYVVQSLYIIIPIMLSILFYKENFGYKKFLAVCLTILSILFLK